MERASPLKGDWVIGGKGKVVTTVFGGNHGQEQPGLRSGSAGVDAQGASTGKTNNSGYPIEK